MPRPKKDDALARSESISFRLTVAEMDQLRREAASCGLLPNEYARVKANGAAVHAVHPAAVQAETPRMFELRHQLIRLGVNLNQIARRLNMSGEYQPEALTDVTAHLDEIFQQMLEGVEFD